MKKRMLIWAGVWLMIAVGAVIARLVIFDRTPGPAGDELPVLAANVVFFPASPFNAAMWIVGLGDVLGRVPTYLIASLVGWGGVVVLLAAAEEFRRRWSHGAGNAPTDFARPEPVASGEATSVVSPLSRRRFLVNAGFGLAAVGTTGTLARASVFEPMALVVRRYRVPITGLPDALAGLRLVHLSDLHLGPIVPRSLIEDAVRTTLLLEPDLILITCDMIESRHGSIQRHVEVLAPIATTPVPTLAVLGNHDWYGDGPAVRAALERVGIRMLDNTRLFLDSGSRRIVDAHRSPPGSLCLAGLGDLTSDATDIDGALGGVSPGTPTILLTHQPDTFELRKVKALPERAISLGLCGHTHGGQVALPFIGAPIVPSAYGSKYAGGLVQSPVGSVIVSRGVGLSGIPIRLGVPPEVVEITLEPA